MAWDWGSIIPAIIGGIGAWQDRENAKSPDMPESLSYEQILSLIMQNSQSPWGNTTYTKGDDGMYTREYEFTPEQQAIYDRGVDRSLNPDQAYQMPGQLYALQEALMNQRLNGMGVSGNPTPRTSPRPPPRSVPGGSRPTGPFTPAPEPNTPPPQVAHGSEGNYGRTGTGGNSMTRDPFTGMGQGMGMTPSDNRGNNWSFNDRMNRMIPGPLQGSNPNKFGRGLVEQGDHIGDILGAITGIPGLGLLGKFGQNMYWKNHQWQSPATNLPQSGNDMLNEAIDGRSSPAGEARGGGRANSSAWGGPNGGGGWYYDSSGQLRFSRSGTARIHGS